jgi:two-component system NtrC family sensor kinase
MIQEGGLSGSDPRTNNKIRISIATKLVLSFLLIIFMTSAIFTGVVIVLISDHMQSDAQEQVREDLTSAREVYLARLDQINSVVRSTARTSFVEESLLSGDIEQAADELAGIRILEALDYLTIVDESGIVLYRSSNADYFGDDNTHDRLVDTAMKFQMPAAATTIISSEDLGRESPQLAEHVSLQFASTHEVNALGEREYTDGMVLSAAAPIFNSENTIIGAVYGGILLNGNLDFVCEIKQDIYRNTVYNGKEIGYVTIYQDDVGILSCPFNQQGSGSIGSRIDEDVFSQVVIGGKPWIGRDLVLDNWYITASQPIWDADHETVGVLQVGTVEQQFLDTRDQFIMAFLTITIIGALIAIVFAYFISRQISVPLNKLVSASRNIAEGDLDARVDRKFVSDDELGELANAFNVMASALKQRDEKLRELTRYRIKRSERLALIGKLAANVAHELNNPLQGIVTYSHLMLEQMPADHPNTGHVQVIVTQANRCRDIIRGLLDFSRQREPDKTLCNVNAVLQDCISLLVNQALFHNIEINIDLDDDLPLVIADPSQIERVFLNMMINAAESMAGSGQLTLKTRTDGANQSIEVIISDTGDGIAEEDLKRIFDPFYTTKEVGKGTGLGLAISYGITMEHSGTISVESEVGKGTTFTVRLPIIADEKV